MPSTIHISAIPALVFLLSMQNVFAQTPVTVNTVTRDGYYYMLPDMLFTREEALINKDGKLAEAPATWNHSDSKRVINFGSTAGNIWMKFNLENSDTVSKTLMFVAGSHTTYELELFESNDAGIFSLGKTGTKYPYYHRPYPLIVFTYPVHLAAKENKTFFLRLAQHNANLIFIPIAYTVDQLKADEQRAYATFGLYAGIILLVSSFNLFLYFAIKEKIHLLYFIYAMNALWVIFSQESLDFQLFYPNHPEWYMALRFASSYLFVAMLFSVMQNFLQQSAANSRFYTISNIIKYACFAMGPFVFIMTRYDLWGDIYKWHMLFYEIILSAGLAVIILSCVEKIRQGFYLAWFYLAATLVTITGAIISILLLAGLVNIVPMPPTLVETGITAEAVIISFGILYRYNYFKREKEKLALELHEEKIRSAEQILQTQEMEQKRIAQDLHDELGGNLAAIKMVLQNIPMDIGQSQTLLYLIDKASVNARNIAHNLMPPEFEHTSLGNILTNFYKQLNAENKIKFHFYLSGSNHHFNKQDELMLYRIIMELTSNIIKHSCATEATIQLVYYDAYLEMMTEDNGKGFTKNGDNGAGIKNIFTRVNYLGGKINTDSGKHGTTTMIQIPYSKHES